WSLNHAQWGLVAFDVSRVDRDRRLVELARARNNLAATRASRPVQNPRRRAGLPHNVRRAVVDHVEQAILRVERDAVGISQLGLIALDQTKGGVLDSRRL